MRYNILVGGKAGFGINEIANIAASSLASAGFFVFNYREYPSLISGGHNFNVVCISDRKTTSYDDKIDVMVAFDERTYTRHKEQLSADCIISTSDLALKDKIKCTYVDSKKYGKSGNMAFVGFLLKVLGLDAKFGIDELEKKFSGNKHNELNKQALLETYSMDFGASLALTPSERKGFMLSGSEAVVNGAVDAGIECYFGYPMTPSTFVLIGLAQKQMQNDFKVFTMESEVSVINTAYGTSFAGKRTMVGTAGGGFDLMTEALSMGATMELPMVLLLAQRAGPSTGVPTFTSQADMNIALYGGHGDFPRIVVSGGDAKESYEKTIEAFYLSEKFNASTILLLDKHVLESGFLSNITNPKIEIPKRQEYAGKGHFKRNSYEHNDQWDTTEDPKEISHSVEKRIEKIKLIDEETKRFERFKVYGSGENLLIGYGSTKGAILDSLPELSGFKYIHVMYLDPFPKEIINEIKKSKKVYVVEGTAFGQFADLITKNTGHLFDSNSKILRYDSLPFTPKYLIDEIRKRN